MYYSFNINGEKENLSEFISNISPEDTFIVSSSKKEPSTSTIFKWQTEALDKVVYDLSKSFDVKEGENVPTTDVISVHSTELKNGQTQIFRKTFSISDSALATALHGREAELKHQLGKAGKEVKNVMEMVYSSKQARVKGSATAAPKTDGLFSQIAALDADNPDLPQPTKAGDNAVHKKAPLDFTSIDSIALALYRSGSKANVIILNPVNNSKINDAIEAAATAKVKQLEIYNQNRIDTKTIRQTQVNSFTDSLGRIWEIKYSRWCPVDLVYFVNPEDLTQRVLREPVATQLGRNGAFETWQVIIEAGLQLSNSYAAGVLEITTP